MRVIVEQAQCEIEVKKSRFIAIALPLTDLSEIKQHVHKIRSEHTAANHVVHAAVVGSDGQLFSCSDDHEPKNTAGRPALEVLKGSSVTNILVMVVRYFGGTLLGTGGLVKAYSDSVKEVLKVIKTEELVEKTEFLITIPYNLYELVRKHLVEAEAAIISEEFTTAVLLKGNMPSSHFAAAQLSVFNLTNGLCSLNPNGL